MNRKIKVILLGTVFSIALGAFGLSGKVFAATESGLQAGDALKKWTFTLFYSCMMDGRINSSVTAGAKDALVQNSIIVSKGDSKDKYFPNRFSGKSIKDDAVNCATIFKGSNGTTGKSGVMNLYGNGASTTTWGGDVNSAMKADELMAAIGYTKNASDASNDTAATLTIQGRISVNSSKMNSYDGKQITMTAQGKKDKKGVWSFGTFSYSMDDGLSSPIQAKFISQNKKLILTILGENSSDGLRIDLTNVKSDIAGINQAINSAISSGVTVPFKRICGGTNQRPEYCTGSVTMTADIQSESGSESNTYNPKRTFTYNGGPDITLSNLSGYSSATDLVLNDAEKYGLYEYYASNAIDLSASDSCHQSDTTPKLPIHLLVNGEWKIYYYRSDDVKISDGFRIQTADGTSTEVTDINTIVEWLNSFEATEFGADETCPQWEQTASEGGAFDRKNVIDGQEGSTSDGDPSERCFENAGVMGHTLCPILSAVSQFTDSIYYYIENNFLMINTNEMFGSGGNGGVRDAWGVVRDIANVCFVIVLLVIIFSQITGFGIDNYGIKRMLPRLIVMAVVVNISFFICQIMVDISNIAGVSIKNFMEGTIQLNNSATTIGNSGGAAGILGTVAAGGILVGLAFLNPGIILALISGIISAVIGLLFMFVILLARQIGVIILIILAPLAFICYMLPNTEKYFTKWRTAFLAVLLAYPLCALAMGAGTMVGNIMANTGSADGNAVLLIGAMIVNVLPFFFIPMLLQNALSALGNIGGKIAGIGQRIGRGVGGFASGAVQRGRTFNNLNNASKEFNAEYLRKGERSSLERRVARLNRIPEKNRSASQQRHLALAQSRLNTMNAEDATAEVGIKAKSYEDLLADANARRYQEDVNAIKARNVQSGAVNNIGTDKKYVSYSGDNIQFAEGSLAQQLLNYGMESNQEGMAAVAEQMTSKGHTGQEGLRQVLDQLYRNSENTELSEDDRKRARNAIQSISSTIMNDGNMSKQYKGGALSTYNYMKKAASGEIKGNVNDLATNALDSSKLSAQALANMDKEELDRLDTAIQRGAVSSTEAARIGEFAQEALSQGLIKGGAKGENQRVLQSISGYTMRVDHSGSGSTASGATSGSGSTPAPSSSGDAAMDAFQQAQANINAERMAQQQRQNVQNSADATGEMYENIFNNQRDS